MPWMIICDLFSIDSFPVWILIPSFIASIYKESLKKKNGELSIFKHNVELLWVIYPCNDNRSANNRWLLDRYGEVKIIS